MVSIAINRRSCIARCGKAPLSPKNFRPASRQDRVSSPHAFSRLGSALVSRSAHCRFFWLN